MTRLTTFRFALDLDPEQERACRKHAGAARKAWNWGVELVNQRMKQRREEIDKGSSLATTEVPLTRNRLIPAFNAFKLGPEGRADGIGAWYTEVSKFCFEEALVDLSRAFSAFFSGSTASRKVGFPVDGTAEKAAVKRLASQANHKRVLRAQRRQRDSNARGALHPNGISNPAP